jgi:hypothetical protein
MPATEAGWWIEDYAGAGRLPMPRREVLGMALTDGLWGINRRVIPAPDSGNLSNLFKFFSNRFRFYTDGLKDTIKYFRTKV